MCSQAMVNARQTPILASPSANIAGNQTNRFIIASYVPLGACVRKRLFGKWKTGADAQASAFAASAGRRWLAKAAAVSSSTPFPLYFDEVS